MISTVRRLSLALLAVPLGGCSAAASPLPDAYVDGTDQALRGSSASASAYTFFLVSRAGAGFVASELGSHVTRCLDGSSRGGGCPVGEVDLSALELAPADAAPLLDAITRDEARATEVFVGTFERRATLRGALTALRVREVWRAPEAGTVRAADGWYHVSHDARQALAVNRWQRRDVAGLDLAAAPWMSECDPDADGNLVCVPTQDGVLEDAATAAGILVDGAWSADGVLHVRQYLAKIGVGKLHATNGYWFCRAGQIACDDGVCGDVANDCDHQGFHGGGLKSVYLRTTEASAQPWLVSTTQLTPAESAALTSPAP